jgi:hypothetical protein
MPPVIADSGVVRETAQGGGVYVANASLSLIAVVKSPLHK